jgi:hypothetical protein
MTTVVTTTFAGSDNAAWPSPWTQVSGTSRIATNRGEQTTPTGAFNASENRANVVITDGRVDATLRFPALTNRSQRINVRWNPATGNGYRLLVPTDYAGFQLLRVDAYTETPLQEEFTSTWSAATDYKVAVEFTGTTIRAKKWLASGSEPGTWNLSATDATYTSGDVALVTVNGTSGGAVTGLWDDVTVADNGVVRSGTRVGFHNDAFLAAFADFGTYTTFTDFDETTTRAYTATQTAVGLPMVGESAATNGTTSQFPNAGTELATYRWSSLNSIYHPDVLASWSTSDKTTVAQKLGYRLRLTTAVTPATSVAASSSFSVSLTFTNDGYAATYRARPTQLVMVNGATVVTRTLAFDIRTVGPGQTVTATENVTAPSSAGTYTLSLMFPDPSAGIATRAEYAIQLANVGVWDSTTGRNSLGVSLTAA